MVCERHPPDSVRHAHNVSPTPLARDSTVSHRDRSETLSETGSRDPKCALSNGDVKSVPPAEATQNPRRFTSPCLVMGGAILVIMQRPISLDLPAVRAEHPSRRIELKVWSDPLGKE